MRTEREQQALDELLLEIADYLEDCSDIRDGGDGVTLPNTAMLLLQDLEPFLPKPHGDKGST